MSRSCLNVAGVLSILLLVGCAAPAARPDEVPDHASDTPAAAQPLEPGIYEVATGERLDPDALAMRLEDARFVVIGESHDDAFHHAVQLRVYELLQERHERPVALGMEMFHRPFQEHLDAFVAGDIDEARMLERTEYATRWGFDAAFYRPLWTLARQTHSPIVALNAPRELSRKVGRVGLDGLDDAERAQIPDDIDLGNEAHRAYLYEVFAHHGMGDDPERAERFYQAQVLWDETMADTAVTFMREHDADVAAIVILAGRGHVERGWGIPSRIARRLGPDAAHTVVTIIPVTLDENGAPRAGAPYTSLTHMRDEAVADFVWVGPE